MYLLDSLWKFKAILIVTGVIAGVAGGIFLAIWSDNKHCDGAAAWFAWGRRLLIYCPIGLIIGLLMPTGDELTGYKNSVQEYRERRQHEADLAMREELLKIEMTKLEQARLELDGASETQAGGRR
jgi:hypothetical protein